MKHNEPEQTRPQLLRQILGVIQPNTPVVLQRRKSLSNASSNNNNILQASNPKITSEYCNSNNISNALLNHNTNDQGNSSLHPCSKSSKHYGSNTTQDKVLVSRKRASVYDLNEAKRQLSSQELQWSEYHSSSNGAKSSVNTSFKLSRRQSKEKLIDQMHDIQQSWKIQKDLLVKGNNNSGNYNVQRHLIESQQNEQKETNGEQGGNHSVESSYISRLSNNSHSNTSNYNLNGIQMMSQLTQQQQVANGYFSKDPQWNLSAQPSKEELLTLHDKLSALEQENQQLKEENKILQRDFENQMNINKQENERLNERISQLQQGKDAIESNLQGQINSLSEQLRGKTIELIIWQERYNNLEIVHNQFIHECRQQKQIEKEKEQFSGFQVEKDKFKEENMHFVNPASKLERIAQSNHYAKDNQNKFNSNLMLEADRLVNVKGQNASLSNHPENQQHFSKRFDIVNQQIDAISNHKMYPKAACSFDLSKIYGNSSQQEKQCDQSQQVQSYQYPSPSSLRISPLNTQITSNRESSPTFLDKSVVIS